MKHVNVSVPNIKHTKQKKTATGAGNRHFLLIMVCMETEMCREKPLYSVYVKSRDDDSQ